ncbi:hypothetical protein BQ8794_30346 [Mesorhizobium prunaredense]|uniref:Uncharacterized protein n=1 Tax=Mesorhizobium prunaredense TaxID=1631249 RepID=A0A1R3VAE9_9HYPH|nr:hypothetical protein BQ8794_30346 [Mesorhizobium prunaredense]
MLIAPLFGRPKAPVTTTDLHFKYFRLEELNIWHSYHSSAKGAMLSVAVALCAAAERTPNEIPATPRPRRHSARGKRYQIQGRDHYSRHRQGKASGRRSDRRWARLA